MIWFEPPNRPQAWTYTALKAIDNNLISSIEDYANANPEKLQSAAVHNNRELGQQRKLDIASRVTDIMWLDDMQTFKELYDRVIDVSLTVNFQNFKYSISFIEPLQYSVYRGDELGNYDIHCDSTMRDPTGFNRKISFSILLNDPSEFEGGELKFHYLKDPVVAELNKGDMVLFPSFIPHSVAPVTKGVRRSLVGWICGPNFV